MPSRVQIANGFRFGPFSLDRDSGHLYKNGTLSQRLRHQVHDGLVPLLDRAPEIVTKEELVAAIWVKDGEEPAGGVRGIIGEIREALSPEGRNYIENVQNRGYRFVETVRIIRRPGIPRWVIWAVIGTVVVVIGPVLRWQARRTSSPPVPTPVAAVSIDSPEENDKVTQRWSVKGHLLPAGVPLCVVIHPEGTDGYHNQPNVIVSGDTWQVVDAYFGEAGNDVGLSFQIMAITGCTLSPGVLTGWPRGSAYSKTVTVTRR